MLLGECAGTEGTVCNHDGEGEPTQLKLQVCRSAAGYYLGYWCSKCGPFSRESHYFDSETAAERALKDPDAHDRI